jgi:antibiotic biosynthesis monooxygenase (ABM) superfamily enzyme
MIVVVSQAWTLDAEGHADAYIALSREFLAFMRQHPGFHGRRLLRGVEDRTHFTNFRLFDQLSSYDELTKIPGYNDHILRMGAHLKPYTTYPREFMDVVIDEDPLP